MTVAELVDAVEVREAEDRDRMVLCMDRKKPPKGRRVRVLPGVMGVFIGWAGGSCIVDVSVADVRRYLERL